MIRPISFADNRKINFKGQIKETDPLVKALKKFTPQELAEFNELKLKASKISDGRNFFLCMGGKIKTKEAAKDECHYYTQFYESKEGKYYPAETYRVAKEGWRRLEEITVSTDDSAFARAILNPLREIYNK